MATFQFSLGEFMENPTFEEITNICKVNWASIAKHNETQITSSMRKEQLKNVVVESLVERGVLQAEAPPVLTPADFPLQHEITETSPLTYTTATTLDAEKLFELEKFKLQFSIQVEIEEKQALGKEKHVLKVQIRQLKWILK